MTKPSFKIGDLVRLKSGGPTMTVSSTVGTNGTKWQWFAGKKMEWGSFPVDSLVVSIGDDDAKSKTK